MELDTLIIWLLVLLEPSWLLAKEEGGREE